MASSSNILHLLPLLVLLAIFLPCIRCDDIPDMIKSQCGDVVNNNQPSPTNADKMISDLLNLAPQHDFSYYTHQDSGLYGLAWCLGDAFAQNCSACLAGAAQRLMDICSHQTTSARIVFQDFCYLRVDTIDFLQTLDYHFTRLQHDEGQMVPLRYQEAFGKSSYELMNELERRVSQQNDKKFARGQAIFDPENSVINGMAQCVNELSVDLCELCLQFSIEHMKQGACNHSKRCQVFMGGSCILQYAEENKITN